MHLAFGAATAQQQSFKAETPNPCDGAGRREPGWRRIAGGDRTQLSARAWTLCVPGLGCSQETPNPDCGTRTWEGHCLGTSEPQGRGRAAGDGVAFEPAGSGQVSPAPAQDLPALAQRRSRNVNSHKRYLARGRQGGGSQLCEGRSPLLLSQQKKSPCYDG